MFLSSVDTLSTTTESPYTPGQPLTDADFHPEFEQKGVDMRIGIDMANLSSNRSVELIALATNDTDCIPAMKHARRTGLQVALITAPGYQPVPELLAHSDFSVRLRGRFRKHHTNITRRDSIGGFLSFGQTV